MLHYITDYFSSPEAREQRKLEQTKQRIHIVTEESLTSTTRMAALVEKARETGTATLRELEMHRAKLNGMERNLETQTDVIEDVEEDLTTLRRCWQCCCCCPSSSCFSRRPPNASSSDRLPNDVLPSESRTFIPSEIRLFKRTFPKSALKKKPTEEENEMRKMAHDTFVKFITRDKHEEEMNRQLTMIENTVAELHAMALGISTTVDETDVQLDRVMHKAIFNTAQIRKASVMAKAILNDDD